jgi:hypothetical protein
MKKSFSVFCTLIALIANSQNNSLIYLDNFTKIGLNLQYTNTAFSNQTNTGLILDYLDVESPVIGINYNIFQHNNFNFKANTNVRFYNHQRYTYIGASDLGAENNILNTYTESGLVDLLTRIKSEYVFSRGKNIFLNVGTGFSILYYKRQSELNKGIFDFNENRIFTYDWSTGNKNIYLGALFSLGMDISTKSMLYQLFVEYNHNLSGPTDIYTYTTSNLLVSENSTVEKRNTGHYLSFGISLHPKKSWFEKKKNKFK